MSQSKLPGRVQGAHTGQVRVHTRPKPRVKGGGQSANTKGARAAGKETVDSSLTGRFQVAERAKAETGQREHQQTQARARAAVPQGQISPQALRKARNRRNVLNAQAVKNHMGITTVEEGEGSLIPNEWLERFDPRGTAKPLRTMGETPDEWSEQITHETTHVRLQDRAYDPGQMMAGRYDEYYRR